MKLTKEQKVKLYTNMIRTRKVDEFFVSAFDEKKLAGAFFHSQQGQEAVGTGFCTFLRQDDYLFNSHRGHGIAELISKGVPINKIIAEHYGKVTGTCRGMGYMYTCSLEHGVFGMVGTLGGEAPLAAGVALAAKFRDQGQVVAFVSSDGAMGEGAIHEALLMIANWKLPVVVVASNNQYQMWVPTSAAYPKENIADLAFGYGIPAEVVDGQDVMAVFEAVQTATDRARAGKGPSFIECKTYHFRSHMEGSPQYIVDKIRGEDEVIAWEKRDPIELFKKKLLEDGSLSQDDIVRIDREAMEEVEEAEKFALESPLPTPDILQSALYSD